MGARPADRFWHLDHAIPAFSATFVAPFLAAENRVLLKKNP